MITRRTFVKAGGCALVAHAVRAALAADLSPVVVVVGREFEAVANAVARDAPGVVAFVRTPDGFERRAVTCGPWRRFAANSAQHRSDASET